MVSPALLSSALLALTTSTLAAKYSSSTANATGGFACMSRIDARKVADNFKDLINLKFNTTLAESAMVPTFQDFSDGVNELINVGCPGPNTLGGVTFASRAEFIAGQSGQPPIPFEILNLWHTCDSVHIRWRSSKPGPVQPIRPVTGMVAIETTPNPDGSDCEQPWLMTTVYSEFNSGAWLSDLGNFTAECTNAGLPVKPNVMMKMKDACDELSSSSTVAASTEATYTVSSSFSMVDNSSASSGWASSTLSASVAPSSSSSGWSSSSAPSSTGWSSSSAPSSTGSSVWSSTTA